eukprot:TRINITY_DN67984_c2_g1_i5.p1 TRINITY_DN67984_c2_g1~~TRINITY_DN67984_c2_g1_i5.p1  ORF type:complete len:226 (-),score=26.10 TRINITY_DN67984_c2_g1_i5:290-943(-)
MDIRITELIVNVDHSQNAVIDGLKEYATKNNLSTDVIDQLEEDFNSMADGLAVLRAWTAVCWLHEEVNNVLRSEQTVKLRLLAPFVKALCHALKTNESDFTDVAANFPNGLPTTLKRRMKLSPEELQLSYKVNGLFTWTGFVSTSLLNPSLVFGRVLFEIEYNDVLHNSGLFLEHCTQVAGEYEVLLPPGCQFKVKEMRGGLSPVVKLQLLSTMSFA